ncbi:rab-GTPase-TBC domain-containing protein [Sarocladium implicatum]|nr:rab-GTPase-TBC domain-containing protein [Sarocladium implicatum]
MDAGHDSLVTVRLSEPPSLTVDTALAEAHEQQPVRPATDMSPDDGSLADAAEIDDTTDTTPIDTPTPRDSPPQSPIAEASRSLEEELEQCSPDGESRQSISSEDQDEVNWEQLEKTEDEQTKDEETDNSTALLLARLEQENAKLATNPKSVKVEAVEQSATNRPRPPSMAQLRQMITGPTPPNLRYSMLPPPPMTDLEFYAALVKDYQQTAARLPTLLSNKIRKGIPPPLRGVVWQSMSGARDAGLEDLYDRFGGESSPYELIIGKDLGRSFPGVDMFRDPEGDGQRMLGRVLKSFSLYDTKIGYCQGLAFLVGPLLMHMPDKQAFCVLVRLMERYDLRSCFLPDLSGLHVRIYQFRELLRQLQPDLSAHLEELQVDPAYVSQWFLSFFAVTCPLPMLFRIYDVIFAEGASETLMRVALSLMRKNEARLLACTELEDAMQLLLSRGLWDCYHYDADEFVQDFASLTGEVSREKLSQLEQGYRESLIATANAVRTSAITTAASRFLGRIWATSTVLSPKSALSPGLIAPSRPLSLLRRSTSKQSLASTLNSMEAGSNSILSSTSTDATQVSRDSANTEDETASRESTPVGPKVAPVSKGGDNRHLHSQIEDLLTALSELQRDHALLSNQLQREREDREEDRKAVQTLLASLKRQESDEPSGMDDTSDITKVGDVNEEEHVSPKSTLAETIEQVENRFYVDGKRPRSSLMQTKLQLRDELTSAKDQLTGAMVQSQELSRRIHEQDQELSALKEQVRESHAHVRGLHQDKQRLEKQVHNMRARSSTASAKEASTHDGGSQWPSKSSGGGLRELKLGRSKSSPSQPAGFNRRISSMPRGHESLEAAATTSSAVAPTSEHEGLLLELVQAKTAEAIAKQEAEEAKQKLEAIRKAFGLAPGDTPTATTSAPTGAAGAAMGVFGRLTGQTAGATTPNEASSKATTPAATGNPAGGGFWGWRR